MTKALLELIWNGRVLGHLEKTLISCMSLTAQLTPTTKTTMAQELQTTYRRWLIAHKPLDKAT
jgi:hypothetical protein